MLDENILKVLKIMTEECDDDSRMKQESLIMSVLLDCHFDNISGDVIDSVIRNIIDRKLIEERKMTSEFILLDAGKVVLSFAKL